MGNTIVRAWIREDGMVDRVEVLLGRPFGISEAVVAAVRQWKFVPAKIKGIAVPVIYDIAVSYTPPGEAPPQSRN
jgi:TonB family protein